MHRYFLCLSYDGSHFHGWQKQPNAITVQEVLENALTTLMKSPVEIVGCGRTDTGVHAQVYYCHMDLVNPPPEQIIYQLNAILPSTIAVNQLIQINPNQHARFDATERAYTYYIHSQKNPFLKAISYLLPQMDQYDKFKLNESTHWILHSSNFIHFCKTGGDHINYHCQLFHVSWQFDEEQLQWKFIISANRFLRGMVRLLVGASLNYARGMITRDEFQAALSGDKNLPVAWSVPAEGLFLSNVIYPFIKK